ncbi:MAG: hypothetical protein ACRES9_06010 [Gammaproteobacteria bacterium]
MKATIVLLVLGWAAVAGASTGPPEYPLYRADRYCAEVAQAAVVVFNQRIAGASEANMNKAATVMEMRDPATGIILKAVVKRVYHGPHPLITRKAVIDYAYRYCMDAPAPAPST